LLELLKSKMDLAHSAGVSPATTLTLADRDCLTECLDRRTVKDQLAGVLPSLLQLALFGQGGHVGDGIADRQQHATVSRGQCFGQFLCEISRRQRRRLGRGT
jgi:hypothetical protein